MTGALARAGGRALSGLGASVDARRLGLHALAIGLVSAGGAATGWLAAGTAKGAIIGAGAHLGLYGLAGAMFGAGRLGTAERVVYGLLGLGSVGLVAYLHFGGRR